MASPAQPVPEADRVASTCELLLEADQVASQRYVCMRSWPGGLPRDAQATGWWGSLASHARWTCTSSQLCPINSDEDAVAYPPCPNEVTLAHWSRGYAMFGPHWPEGAHQTMDTLPGSPGPPKSRSGRVRRHTLKGAFCQVITNSGMGLQHPTATALHASMHRVTWSQTPEPHLCTMSTSIYVMFAYRALSSVCCRSVCCSIQAIFMYISCLSSLCCIVLVFVDMSFTLYKILCTHKFILMRHMIVYYIIVTTHSQGLCINRFIHSYSFIHPQ